MNRPARQRPAGVTGISLPVHVESLAPSQPANEPSPRPSEQPTPSQTSPSIGSSLKEPLSTRIPAETLAIAKDAVLATAGHPDGVRSLAELVTIALEDKVAQLQRDLNYGQPFPTRRDGVFRTGRPIR